jgi:hypothetical protein
VEGQHKPRIHESFLVARHTDRVNTHSPTPGPLVETSSHEDSVYTVLPLPDKNRKYPDRQRINIRNEASLTDINFIVELTHARGGQIASEGLMCRHLNSYRYGDQVTDDNAKHQRAYCNKMPSGTNESHSVEQKK